MNKNIKELAEEAGFVFWGDEKWGPGPGLIDWSCDYKNEFDKFTDLFTDKAISLCHVETDASNLSEYDKGMIDGYMRARENLQAFFKGDYDK